MSEPVVADASPLILLSRAERLDLLQLLPNPVLVPDAVAQEILRKGRGDVTAKALKSTAFLERIPAPPTPAAISAWELGAGETAVLAVAHEKKGSIAMLDDMEARRCAESLGIAVLGTAGLVLAAKLKGAIPRARPVLEALVSVGMYLSRGTLDRLLLKVDE